MSQLKAVHARYIVDNDANIQQYVLPGGSFGDYIYDILEDDQIPEVVNVECEIDAAVDEQLPVDIGQPVMEPERNIVINRQWIDVDRGNIVPTRTRGNRVDTHNLVPPKFR